MNRIVLWVFGLPFFILLLSFLHLFSGAGLEEKPHPMAILYLILSPNALLLGLPLGLGLGFYLLKIWLVPSIVLTFIVQLATIKKKQIKIKDIK